MDEKHKAAEAMYDALREAIPYVNAARYSTHPWRVETATDILSRIQAALKEWTDKWQTE